MATNFLTYSRRKWRDAGYYVEGTESIIRLPGGMTRRNDLFGFADLVAIPIPEPGEEVMSDDLQWIYLQVTAWGSVSTRLRKIQRETTGKGQWERPLHELARAVLDHGDRIIIEGWQQEKAYAPWEDRELEVTYDHLDEAEAA